MKSRCENSKLKCEETFSRACLQENGVINALLSQTRKSLVEEFAAKVSSNERLLQLALNEAEAVAWQTEYPHLVFPSLAAEKAQATVVWHQRQSKITRRREKSFAA